MQDPLMGKKFGHCRIERKLGSGGMGSVYLAHHDGLHKPVAIKVLSRELASKPEFVDRFLREARLAARLEHPNVVQVFDVGQADGVNYIAMQYVEGKTLDAILKERKKLSVGEAIGVVKRVAVALAAAHKLGIVHRDIKPANVLISKEGVVKVADFGLAKDEDAARSVSGTGQIVGTPYYMSPEQAQGDKVDARTDIYSLGATLYHLVTGRRVFEGHTPLTIVMKQVQENPVPPREIVPDIPEPVCALIAKMMAKGVADRHGSAEELIRDLDAAKSGVSMVRTRAVRPTRKAAIIALPIAGILAVGIVLGMVLAGGEAPPPAPPPVEVRAKPASKPLPPAPVEAKETKPRVEPEPPRPAKADPPAKAENRRERIMSRFKESADRRLAEDLYERVEAFMAALEKKDPKQVKSFLDRLTVGDLPEDQLGEMFRILAAKVELKAWEILDVEVRRRLGPALGVVSINLTFAHPTGELALKDQPMHWLHRRDGLWYATRPPAKPADR